MSSSLLYIDTDQVLSLSNQIIQAQEEIEQNARRVLAEVSSLDWTSPGRESFVAEAESLVQQVCQLTEQGRLMAMRVDRHVTRWETAGQAFSGSLVSGGVDGIVSGGGLNLAALTLPLALGAPFAINQGSISGLPTWIQEIVYTFFPGLREPQELPANAPGAAAGQEKPPGGAQTAPQTGFGKLIEEAKRAAMSAPSASSGSSGGQEKTGPPAWYADVPVKSQKNLLYQGKDTAYGCTPTGASMITDYWSAQDPQNQTVSAQDLLAMNVTDQEFGAKGMSIDHLADDLEPLGYEVETYSAEYGKPDDQANALRSALSRGPVLAVVRLNMDANSKDIHTMVVTGISPEGTVRVNDPWDGSVKEYSWEQFDKVWGSNFGQDSKGNPYPTRMFTTILPAGPTSGDESNEL